MQSVTVVWNTLIFMLYANGDMFVHFVPGSIRLFIIIFWNLAQSCWHSQEWRASPDFCFPSFAGMYFTIDIRRFSRSRKRSKSWSFIFHYSITTISTFSKMWVLVILGLHKSTEIISRLQDPMKGIKLNLQGKNAKVRKRWGKGPHVSCVFHTNRP